MGLPKPEPVFTVDEYLVLERGSLDPQASHQRFRIRAQVEMGPDRGAPPGCLRIRSRAQIFNRFGGVGQRVFDCDAISQRRYTLQLTLPHGTAHIAPQQGTKILEFKCVLGLHQSTPSR